MTDTLPQMADAVGNGVILSTCNRTELYSVQEDVDSGAESILAFLSNYHDVTEDDISRYTYELHGGDTAHHLFAVASGLD